MALAIYADAGMLASTVAQFPWELYPVVLLLTFGNYAGRIIKWKWYLNLVGANVGWRDAARIFGVAMTMVLTPGKAGELVKAYMVKNVSGTPMRMTAPIVLSERLTDGLAMMLLSTVGLYSFRDPQLLRLALAILAVMIAVVLFVWIRPLALWVLNGGRHVPWLRNRVSGLRDFYESSYLLLRPRNLFIAIFIGTVSWSFEGVAYYLVLVGVGAPTGPEQLLSAVFIFSISAILGAVLATPGGLGGTEAGLIGLAQPLVGLSRAAATTAALLVRFATLWFGVVIGLICFVIWSDLLEGHTADTPIGDSPESGDEPGPYPSSGS